MGAVLGLTAGCASAPQPQALQPQRPDVRQEYREKIIPKLTPDETRAENLLAEYLELAKVFSINDPRLKDQDYVRSAIGNCIQREDSYRELVVHIFDAVRMMESIAQDQRYDALCPPEECADDEQLDCREKQLRVRGTPAEKIEFYGRVIPLLKHFATCLNTAAQAD